MCLYLPPGPASPAVSEAAPDSVRLWCWSSWLIWITLLPVLRLRGSCSSRREQPRRALGARRSLAALGSGGAPGQPRCAASTSGDPRGVPLRAWVWGGGLGEGEVGRGRGEEGEKVFRELALGRQPQNVLECDPPVFTGRLLRRMPLPLPCGRWRSGCPHHQGEARVQGLGFKPKP